MRRYAWLMLAALLAAAPVAGQDASVTHGFSLGVHAQGAYLDPEDDLNDSGAGAGLDLGYGFRNRISLLLTFGVAAMQPEEGKSGSSYALTQLDLGASYNFLSAQSRWRPFAEAALTTVLATFEDVSFGGQARQDVEISGPAFSVGGGIQYFFTPSWSAGLGLRWSAASFDQVKVGNVTVELDPEDEFDVKITRLQLGVRYHFAAN